MPTEEARTTRTHVARGTPHERGCAAGVRVVDQPSERADWAREGDVISTMRIEADECLPGTRPAATAQPDAWLIHDADPHSQYVLVTTNEEFAADPPEGVTVTPLYRRAAADDRPEHDLGVAVIDLLTQAGYRHYDHDGGPPVPPSGAEALEIIGGLIRRTTTPPSDPAFGAWRVSSPDPTDARPPSEPIRSGYPTAAEVMAHDGVWLDADGDTWGALSDPRWREYGPFTPAKIVPWAWPEVARTRADVLADLSAHATTLRESGTTIGRTLADLIDELGKMTDAS